MSGEQGALAHVSDTALMVAACRAMETASPDGLVHDPFAAELAGDRGMAMARNIPELPMMRFGVGIRSRFLDEMVASTIAGAKITTVLSVGCGLDTRPWRLDLPEGLRWIEVDFAEMLDYKSAAMARHQPRCRRETMAVDLNDAAARQAMLAVAGTAPALMITEGLLAYLPAETVEGLATEPVRAGGIRHWLLDLATPEMARRAGMDRRPSIQNLQAADHLNGLQILELLARHGWTAVQRRTYTRDAWEAARDRILALGASRTGPPPATPPPTDDPSGVHLFARE